MKCTERELREVIRFVIAKNSKYTMNESLTYQKRDLIFEEVLKEIRSKKSLGLLLTALMNLLPGCDINDIKGGTVHPENVAFVRALESETAKVKGNFEDINRAVANHIIDKQLENGDCTPKFHATVWSTLNAKTGDFNFNVREPEVTYEEICQENPNVAKIVNIATNKNEMNKLGDGKADPNSSAEDIAEKQLNKDKKDGTCVLGDDGIEIYTPFCSGGKVNSATLTDDDIVVGKKVSAEDLNQLDSDILNDFLESLKRMIMSSDFEWKNNRNLILVGIKNPNHSLYKGLDINKIDKLHNDWVKNGNNEAAIDKYVYGPAEKSFTDGMMKDNLSIKKSNETWRELGLK